jgi:hypothetical protein
MLVTYTPTLTVSGDVIWPKESLKNVIEKKIKSNGNFFIIVDFEGKIIHNSKDSHTALHNCCIDEDQRHFLILCFIMQPDYGIC